VSTRTSRQATTQKRQVVEHVSLSLLDIVQELFKHVPPARVPQVELLHRLLREQPHQAAMVKEQMLIIAGPEAMRAAVSSIIGAPQKRAAAEAPSAAEPLDSLPPLQSTMADEHLARSQLLPNWQNLARSSTAGNKDQQQVKRARGELGAQEAPNFVNDARLSLLQKMGITPGGIGSVGGLDAAMGSMPRVAPSSSAAFPASSLPLPSVHPFDPSLFGGSSRGDAQRGSGKRGVGEVAEKVKSTTSTFARSSSGLHVPLSHAQTPQLPYQGPLLGLERSRSVNMSGNLSLVELLQCASASDLSMSLGIHSSTNLDHKLEQIPDARAGADIRPDLERFPQALSLCRNRSALRDLNVSEFSISGFLNDAEALGSQAAADLLSGATGDLLSSNEAALPQPSAA